MIDAHAAYVLNSMSLVGVKRVIVERDSEGWHVVREARDGDVIGRRRLVRFRAAPAREASIVMLVAAKLRAANIEVTLEDENALEGNFRTTLVESYRNGAAQAGSYT